MEYEYAQTIMLSWYTAIVMKNSVIPIQTDPSNWLEQQGWKFSSNGVDNEGNLIRNWRRLLKEKS